MEALRALAGVQGIRNVSERNAGAGRGGDAFRDALREQQQGDAPPTAEQPLARTLQPRPPIGRKEQGSGQHIDVLA